MNRNGSSLVSALALGAAALVAVLGGLSAAQDSPAKAAPRAAKVRIGVYDSRAIAVASRDEFLKKQMAGLVEQHKAAEAAGDTKRVAELNARGANLQTLRHLQAFSNGPVDDVVASIAAELPAIARQADVVAITVRTDFHADGVEVVDVTDAMVAALHPNAATLKIVADLRGRKPLDIVDVLGMKE